MTSIYVLIAFRRVALGLLLFTAQRRGDVVTFGRQMERAEVNEHGEVEEWLYFTQEKTGKEMAVPIIAPLREILNAGPTGDLIYLLTDFNKPFTSNGFGNWFRKRCDEAGLPHCTAHGLRKVAGYRLAELGRSDWEIGAVLGHEGIKNTQIYTKAAQQKKLARRAMEQIGDGFSLTSTPKFPNRKKIRKNNRV